MDFSRIVLFRLAMPTVTFGIIPPNQHVRRRQVGLPWSIQLTISMSTLYNPNQPRRACPERSEGWRGLLILVALLVALSGTWGTAWAAPDASSETRVASSYQLSASSYQPT